MRPLEFLLTITNLVMLGLLAFPRLQPARGMKYLVILPALIGIVQVAAEGRRWQMIPAYALSILLPLAWLLRPAGIHMGRAGYIISLIGGILLFAVSAALPIVLPVFRFPKPTGPYAIGTLTYHLTDSSRSELFTRAHGVRRELIAQVWYPARPEPTAPHAPYIPDASDVTPAIGKLLKFPSFIFGHLQYVMTNAVASAPVADDKPNYPVLLYLTGIDGFRSVSTFQIQELVSHGYIVVGLDQPGIAPFMRLSNGDVILGLPRDRINPLIMQSVVPLTPPPSVNGQPLPDGIIPYFARDASFALDELEAINKNDPQHILTGRLDLQHAGAFGISLGGMDAAQACLKDPRLKACLVMDVWMPTDVVKSGLRQPVMFITRDEATFRLEHQVNGTFAGDSIALTIDTMRQTYDKLPGDGYYVQIPGMFHVNFTDLPYWSPLMRQLGQTGPIDAQRGFDIINAYSVAFFDKELKGLASPLLSGPSKQFPEVQVESRRP